MHELVTMMVKGLVDQPENVVVNRVEGDRSVIFEVRVAPDDLGKVIGKGGRTANALRTLVRAAGTKIERKSIWVDINKLGEPVVLSRRNKSVGLSVRRSISILAIVTEQFREEFEAELQEAITTTQHRIDQMDFQSRRFLADLQATDLTQAMNARRQIEAEKRRHEALKQELQQQLTRGRHAGVGL